MVMSGKWTPKAVVIIILPTISWIVFLFLDFLDIILCHFYKLVDEFLEGKACPSCYCMKMEQKETSIHEDEVDRESELSETLHGRRNLLRALMGSLGISLAPGGWRNGGTFSMRRSSNRWSDCGCDSCVEWMQNSKDLRLHVVVKEPQRGTFHLSILSNFRILFLQCHLLFGSVYPSTLKFWHFLPLEF